MVFSPDWSAAKIGSKAMCRGCFAFDVFLCEYALSLSLSLSEASIVNHTFQWNSVAVVCVLFLHCLCTTLGCCDGTGDRRRK